MNTKFLLSITSHTCSTRLKSGDQKGICEVIHYPAEKWYLSAFPKRIAELVCKNWTFTTYLYSWIAIMCYQTESGLGNHLFIAFTIYILVGFLKAFIQSHQAVVVENQYLSQSSYRSVVCRTWPFWNHARLHLYTVDYLILAKLGELCVIRTPLNYSQIMSRNAKVWYSFNTEIYIVLNNLGDCLFQFHKNSIG